MWGEVTPAERLRAVTRRRLDEDRLAIEAADALAGFASEPASLVVACRRVLAELIGSGHTVLGLARYTELDEQYAHAAIVQALTEAAQAGTITVEDPETATRLLSTNGHLRISLAAIA